MADQARQASGGIGARHLDEVGIPDLVARDDVIHLRACARLVTSRLQAGEASLAPAQM